MSWGLPTPNLWLLITLWGFWALGCSNATNDASDSVPIADAGALPDTMTDGPPPPELDTVEYRGTIAPIPKLTRAQITHSIQDLFGDDIVVSGLADPDRSVSGFVTIGSGISTISPRGVESLEAMAYSVAEQVFAEPRRERSVACDAMENECVTETLNRYGRLLWRRPLTEDESARLLQIHSTASERLSSTYAGLEFALAYLLQSPNFVFRKELGQDGLYTSWDLASRLSFLLWDTSPDEALLGAAEAGDLTTDEGLRLSIERLLDDPRARRGFLRFFSQWFGLDELDQLNKDPTVFPSLSADLGKKARQETLLNLEALIFDDDGDFRDFLTTQRTFIDRKLAALYGVRAPLREGFGETILPERSGRVGFLGQASFLIGNSHPVSTSATLRGKFVRERLLCQIVPPPPADVDTSIPEPSGRVQTLRDRVAEHLQNESCRGCHSLTDPIGLAFERFDGLAVHRMTDNDAEIDPSGELDGEPFADAASLSHLIRDHRNFSRCVTLHLHRFVTGAMENQEQSEMINVVTQRFEAQGFRIKELLVEVLESRIFRTVTPTEEVAQ